MLVTILRTKEHLVKFKSNSNNLNLTSICLITNLVTAGFMTTMGLLAEPIASQFNMEITSVSKLFSWFTGAYFVGSIMTYFILDYISARVMMISYVIVLLCAVVINFLNSNVVVLSIILIGIGFFCGTAICIAATIISKIWKNKSQRVALLSQDAIFNLGGVIFPLLTVYFLSSGIGWKECYFVVALTSLSILFFISRSSFEFELKPVREKDNKPNKVFNSSVVIAGISLFLIILGKYIIIIWLPEYAETYLNATTIQTGELISRIFSVALIGSVIGTILLTKVNLKLFICAAVLMGFLSSLQFTSMTSLSSLMLMVSIYGLSLSVLWNAFVAYGVASLKRPSHKHISYIVFCGGAGSTVAPLMSGLLVEAFGYITVMDLVAGLSGTVLLMLIVHGIILRMKFG